MANAATSERRWAASVKIARLFALMPPTTSTAMNITQRITAIRSFLMDADLSFASFEVSEKSQDEPLQNLFPVAPDVDETSIVTSGTWGGDGLWLSI
jgi:hypothetical protein